MSVIFHFNPISTKLEPLQQRDYCKFVSHFLSPRFEVGHLHVSRRSQQCSLVPDALRIHSYPSQKDLNRGFPLSTTGQSYLSDRTVQSQENWSIRGTQNVVHHEPKGTVHPGIRRRGDSRENRKNLKNKRIFERAETSDGGIRLVKGVNSKLPLVDRRSSHDVMFILQDLHVMIRTHS